jgi:predicted TIM-barrel fold metal-dependent hydrolase
MASSTPGPACSAVIDADAHVVEPRSAWNTVPEEYRPRIDRDAHGYEHVVVGDTEILAVPLGTLATPGARFSDQASFRSLEEAHPGGSDPKLRLSDMDTEGIDQAVLYPSVGLYVWSLADPAAATALARAYNDWLASVCATDPVRLFGAAMLPVQDLVSAVAELRRAVRELGFRAAFVRPNPCCGRSLSDPAYEPLWEAAEDLGVAVGVHEGSSVILPTLGSDRPFNPLVLHAVSHSFEEMLAYAQLSAFGVFERHPDLRVVFLESSGGWVPFWLERLDEQAESFGEFCPEMKLRPSEYFARQCWISYEIDEQTLPVLAPLIGEDRIVWGSDYPHHDATFPGAVARLRRTIGPLEEEVRTRVLGTNARDLYRLPEVPASPSTYVQAYFGAIATKDGAGLRRLFAPDAELVVGETSIPGAEEIARFYERGAFTYEDLLPKPGDVSVDHLSADMARVRVELEVRMNGTWSPLVDVFEVAEGYIRRLLIEDPGKA